MGEAEATSKAFSEALRKTRAIRRKLDCLNLSFLRRNITSPAYNAYTAGPPGDRPCNLNRELSTGGQWEMIPLKETNEAPKSH